MPAQPIELPFPIKGLNEGWGHGRQPEGTSPDALNVLPFDPIDNRVRGGQRWGLSKYYSALHNGANAPQQMTAITAMDINEFSSATVAVTGPLWTEYPDAPVAEAPMYNFTGRDYSFSGDYKISLELKTADVVANYNFGIVLRANPAYNKEFFVARFLIQQTAGSASFATYLYRNDSDGTSTEVDYDDTGNQVLFRTLLLEGVTLDIDVAEDGTIIASMTDARFGGTGYQEVTTVTMGDVYDEYSGVGVSRNANWEGGANLTFADLAITGKDVPESRRISSLVAVSGGDVYLGEIGAVPHLATGGTDAVTTTGVVAAEAAFGNMYFCDGNASNYKLLTMSTETVSAWTASVTDHVLPCDAPSDGATYAVASATSGAKTFTYTGDLTGIIGVNDHIKISGSTANDGVYSVSVFDYSAPTTTLTVRQSLVDDTADGNIQLASVGCRIMTLYRGRIALAGLDTDPQNWFMSAAGDPLNWDYGATLSATMAVAGTSADAGKCADIVTCLAPYSDDLMFIGGDHTLWLMRGDPAAGGVIDNVSYQTGIVGPEAYTFDPNGVFYFFGAGTLWRVQPGGVPEPISRSRLDQTFKAIDLTTNTIRLEWDNMRHGLYIFVRPQASGSTTHYYWDERTDSFWKLSFPDAHGPTATLSFGGYGPDDNAVLLSGWDGYIRKIDPDADDDDGTAINSYVYFAPIMAGGILQNTRINRIVAILDAASSDVLLTAYAEDTAQGAIESASIRFARELSAGRTQVLSRVTGNAIAIKLSNTTDDETWALENLIVFAEAVGRTRKRQL